MTRLIIALVALAILVGCANSTTNSTLPCGCNKEQHEHFYAHMPCECGSKCPQLCKCEF